MSTDANVESDSNNGICNDKFGNGQQKDDIGGIPWSWFNQEEITNNDWSIDVVREVGHLNKTPLTHLWVKQRVV